MICMVFYVFEPAYGDEKDEGDERKVAAKGSFAQRGGSKVRVEHDSSGQSVPILIPAAICTGDTDVEHGLCIFWLPLGSG